MKRGLRPKGWTVSFGRVVIGLAIGALAATTALVAPAIGAVDQSVRQAKRMLTLRGAGGFTPAAADPRLAAIVGLAPISYNLGVSVGWKRLAVSSDIARVDLAGLPGSRETADVAVSYTANRFTGRVKASTDRPIEGVAKLIDTPSSYSLDMGGSYALTRNLDVTAGVRYRSDRERLARLDDDRRNSQAVYLGTAFRF